MALPPENRVTVDVERSISQRLWSEGWEPALLRGRINVRGAPYAGEAQTLEATASAGWSLGGGAWEGPERGGARVLVFARLVRQHSLPQS